jgi:hypothetical protein
VLKRYAARLVAVLAPRVRAQWPAIAAIALAVVLAHSGVAHLRAAPELDEHYRFVIGGDGWTHTIGILQLLAAGGLCFRRTRVGTGSALGAVLLAAIAIRLGREGADVATLPSLLLLAWTGAITWGEARQSPPATRAAPDAQ